MSRAWFNRLERGVRAVEGLLPRIVFSGAGITPYHLSRNDLGDLYIPNSINLVYQEDKFHPSENIDLILRSRGLVPYEAKQGIWKFEEIYFHLIPTGPFCPFTHSWFEDGIFLANSIPINERLHVKILPAPYHLATELEIYLNGIHKDFNKKDAAQSIIMLSLWRESLLEEIHQSHYVIRSYILRQFEVILNGIDPFWNLMDDLCIKGENLYPMFQAFLESTISNISESSFQTH